MPWLQPSLEAGEFPFLIDVLLLAVFAPMTWQSLVTIAQRVEPQLYVSLWYLLAALWWTTINMILGSLILPFTMGINSAAFHGLFITTSSGCGSHRRAMS